MIITISGIPGSGKTTVGVLVAKKLGYKFYSMGDLRGKMAMERGMTIDELNKVGASEAWTDKDVDEYQAELGRKEDRFVVDGWVSWHFIPDSFKVLLTVEPDKGAERVFKDQRPDESKVATVPSMKKMLARRVQESQSRYRKYYGIDNVFASSHYDLVIDTSNITAEQAAGKVLEAVKKRK